MTSEDTTEKPKAQAMAIRAAKKTARKGGRKAAAKKAVAKKAARKTATRKRKAPASSMPDMGGDSTSEAMS